MIEALRPLAHPITSKRVAPQFRRLLTRYEQHPVRMRAKTIQYMLETSGLEREQTIVGENGACQFADRVQRDDGWDCRLSCRHDEAGAIGQSPRRQRSRFRTRSLGGDIREAASADNGGLARSMENVDFAFPNRQAAEQLMRGVRKMHRHRNQGQR